MRSILICIGMFVVIGVIVAGIACVNGSLQCSAENPTDYLLVAMAFLALLVSIAGVSVVKDTLDRNTELLKVSKQQALTALRTFDAENRAWLSFDLPSFLPITLSGEPDDESDEYTTVHAYGEIDVFNHGRLPAMHTRATILIMDNSSSLPEAIRDARETAKRYTYLYSSGRTVFLDKSKVSLSADLGRLRDIESEGCYLRGLAVLSYIRSGDADKIFMTGHLVFIDIDIKQMTASLSLVPGTNFAD